MRGALLLGPTSDMRRFGKSARQVEELGYHAAWIPDQGFHRDPFVALATAAEQTSRLQLGLGVANVYTRHPATLARAAGTLAELSAGRFILGLGAGERALKERVGAPRVPFLPTIKTTFTVIRDLMEGRSVTVKSELFELRNARLNFVVDYPVPLYLATRDLHGLRIAGEIADGVILGDFCKPNAVKRSVAHVREGAHGFGRDPSRIQIVSWVITIITDDSQTAKERLRPMLAQTIATMVPDALEMVGVETKSFREIREASLHDSARLRHLIPDDLVDNLSIVGDAADCRRRIESLREAGATQLAMRMPMDLADTFDFNSNLQAFAAHVLPYL
jgi:5,10-methylenetetrahydromethanopterin reductase